MMHHEFYQLFFIVYILYNRTYVGHARQHLRTLNFRMKDKKQYLLILQFINKLIIVIFFCEIYLKIKVHDKNYQGNFIIYLTHIMIISCGFTLGKSYRKNNFIY